MDWQIFSLIVGTSVAVCAIPPVREWLGSWLYPGPSRLRQLQQQFAYADQLVAAADRLEQEGHLRWAKELRQVGREAVPRLAAARNIRQQDQSTYWTGAQIAVAGLWMAGASLWALQLEGFAAQSFQYGMSLLAIGVGFVYLMVAVVRWWIARARFERKVSQEVAEMVAAPASLIRFR
ncbi:hypothetical protein [Millisia brevis]|uniref:hypothetical protein n=1 Tax=Millisia brevis TaxID=264148 RepID=UPI000834590C|nr:hypothetical protein [Millisia brevis]